MQEITFFNEMNTLLKIIENYGNVSFNKFDKLVSKHLINKKLLSRENAEKIFWDEIVLANPEYEKFLNNLV